MFVAHKHMTVVQLTFYSVESKLDIVMILFHTTIKLPQMVSFSHRRSQLTFNDVISMLIIFLTADLASYLAVEKKTKCLLSSAVRVLMVSLDAALESTQGFETLTKVKKHVLGNVDIMQTKL